MFFCLLACAFASAVLTDSHPTKAYAVDKTWIEANAYDTSWYDGSGSYTIRSGAQLAGLSYLVVHDAKTFAGETITLANDVDISAYEWMPIGTSKSVKDAAQSPTGNWFCGTFDGGNHTVSGLRIESSLFNQALFGLVKDAVIKNLSVKGSVYGWDEIAGIVSYANNTSLVNLKNYCNVQAVGALSSDGSYYGGAGGVVASVRMTSSSTIYLQNLENYGTVRGAGDGTGGVIGFLYSEGEVNITQCANYGNVSVDYCVNADANDGAGGILGSTANYGTYKISECVNTGNISSANQDGTGGIAGYLGGNSSFVSYCYNTGSVSGANSAGGVVAKLGANNGTITNSYNSGTISGAVAAAIAAYTSSSARAANNYYLEGSADYAFAGTDIAGAGEVRTYNQMISEGVLNSLNGNNKAFALDASQNNGLPILAWQGTSVPGGGGTGGNGPGGTDPDSQNNGTNMQGSGSLDEGAGSGNGDTGDTSSGSGSQSTELSDSGDQLLMSDTADDIVESAGGAESAGASYQLFKVTEKVPEEDVVVLDDTESWAQFFMAVGALLFLSFGTFYEIVKFRFQRLGIEARCFT